MKILAVIGTRPEAIKICPLILELRKRENVKAEVCATGQHGELFDEVMTLFDISPMQNFGLMSKVHSQEELVTKILTRLSVFLAQENPSLILVHGDTTTALAAALCGFWQKIPVAHVEAGLRTYRRTPFPEEFNRRAISLMANLHFAPTENARENLLREGIEASTVFVTGNTGLDALNYTIKPSWESPFSDFTKDKLTVLVTAHRRESFGRLGEMMSAIADVARARKELAVLVPAHPNPPVQTAIKEAFLGIENVKVIPALGVFDFHNLLSRCFCVLTDSGGIQEEAAALSIPTLVLREETERPEGVSAGALLTLGRSYESIQQGFLRLLDDDVFYQSMKKAKNPYGDGRASIRIADILCQHQNVNAVL